MLTLKADYDVAEITDYTLEVLGEAQTLDYSTTLFQCFGSLAIKPDLDIVLLNMPHN